MNRTLICLACFIAVTRTASAVSLSLSSSNVLVLNADNESFQIFEVWSPGGSLRPPADTSNAAPFDVVTGDQNHLAWLNIGSEVVLDGSVETTVGWEGPFPCYVNWSGNLPVLTPPLLCETPLSKTTIDFGQLTPSDISEATIREAITFVFHELELPAFEITGASIFDVPDFQPVAFSPGVTRTEFDLSVDVKAAPGIYEADLTFPFPNAPHYSANYTLRAEIVPEPMSLWLVVPGGFLLLLRCRCRRP